MSEEQEYCGITEISVQGWVGEVTIITSAHYSRGEVAGITATDIGGQQAPESFEVRQVGNTLVITPSIPQSPPKAPAAGGGGAVVHGSVNTGGGAFVGGDQVIIATGGGIIHSGATAIREETGPELMVIMAPDISVTLEDVSGKVSVQEIGDLVVGTNEDLLLTAKSVNNLNLCVSRGETVVREVRGDAKIIATLSAGITIQQGCSESLDVVNSGSGSVKHLGIVAGTCVLTNIGSGNIVVMEARGTLKITREGRGSVSVLRRSEPLA